MKRVKSKFWSELKSIVRFIAVLTMSNILMITTVAVHKLIEKDVAMGIIIALGILMVALALTVLIVIHIMPRVDFNVDQTRLKVLMGGRQLIRTSYGLLFFNTLGVFLFRDYLPQLLHYQIAWRFTVDIATNYAVSFVIILSLYTNGYFRIVITSRRLSPLKRLLAGLLVFIPPIQLGFAYDLCRVAMEEYDHECYKVNMDKVRIESSICSTKYPLLMLHGVGFRDYKYINYWGRIPKELIKNGSKVYYGHQEAWGTIEDNARHVKKKIFEVIEKEQCAKVNIIAHSKGGLDARYVVSQLGMGDYVASLTMISSPHRGSEVLEFVEKLPKKLVKIIGNGINRHFKLVGDENPNFHVASKQFLVESSKAFNELVKDDPKVYYQSYATVMKTPMSDLLLFLPYCIVVLMAGKNDGLVTVESAKWGKFRGVIKNKYNRGISHGDIIDLKREDYRGFDVREFYVQMVAELKQDGY